MAHAEVLAKPASTFDAQASHYDARVGLPEPVSAAVARAIVEQANAGPGDLVLELGAGTGEIGVHFARLPVRYVGLDSSAAMLDVFHAKADLDSSSLIVADANQPWPLPDGSAAAIFASRVIHLLHPDHVMQETLRVCRSGGYLLLGRVLREPDSLKERLRRRRQELLVDAGLNPRQGEAGTRRVIDGVVTLGGESLGRQEVAAWSGETTVAQVISSWETLSRMGSVAVDPVMRTAILEALRLWARAAFGDLDRAEAFHERYTIDIVRLP